MKVVVKSTSGVGKEFEVEDTISVEELKRSYLVSSFGIPLERCRLIYRGKELNNTQKLQSLDVKNNTLSLFLAVYTQPSVSPPGTQPSVSPPGTTKTTTVINPDGSKTITTTTDQTVTEEVTTTTVVGPDGVKRTHVTKKTTDGAVPPPSPLEVAPAVVGPIEGGQQRNSQSERTATTNSIGGLSSSNRPSAHVLVQPLFNLANELITQSSLCLHKLQLNQNPSGLINRSDLVELARLVRQAGGPDVNITDGSDEQIDSLIRGPFSKLDAACSNLLVSALDDVAIRSIVSDALLKATKLRSQIALYLRVKKDVDVCRSDESSKTPKRDEMIPLMDDDEGMMSAEEGDVSEVKRRKAESSSNRIDEKNTNKIGNIAAALVGELASNTMRSMPGLMTSLQNSVEPFKADMRNAIDPANPRNVESLASSFIQNLASAMSDTSNNSTILTKISSALESTVTAQKPQEPVDDGDIGMKGDKQKSRGNEDGVMEHERKGGDGRVGEERKGGDGRVGDERKGGDERVGDESLRLHENDERRTEGIDNFNPVAQILSKHTIRDSRGVAQPINPRPIEMSALSEETRTKIALWTSDNTKFSRAVLPLARSKPWSVAYRSGDVCEGSSSSLLGGILGDAGSSPVDGSSERVTVPTASSMFKLQWFESLGSVKRAGTLNLKSDDIELQKAFFLKLLRLIAKKVASDPDYQTETFRYPNITKLLSSLQ